MDIVEVLKCFIIEITFLVTLFAGAHSKGCIWDGHHSSAQMPHIPGCFLNT
jgi:hypothetical protein